MKAELLICAAAAVAFTASAAEALAQAGNKGKASHTHGHVTVANDALKWGPIPRDLVEGKPPEEFLKQPPVQFAVVAGDPRKAGALYTVRFKCADGLRVPPHWHPKAEHITVLQGTFGLGHGDRWDNTKGEELAAGGYAIVPGKTPHYGWCKGKTVVQAHGVGPFRIYLGPTKAAKKDEG